MTVLEISFMAAFAIFYLNRISKRGYALGFVERFFLYHRFQDGRKYWFLIRKRNKLIEDHVTFPQNVKVSSYKDLPPKVKEGIWSLHLRHRSDLRKIYNDIEDLLTRHMRISKLKIAISKPLYACIICMTPWYSLLVFFLGMAIGLHDLKFIYLFPVMAYTAGIVMVYMQFKNLISKISRPFL